MNTTAGQPQQDTRAGTRAREIATEALERIADQHEKFKFHGDNVVRDSNIASIAVTALKQIERA